MKINFFTKANNFKKKDFNFNTSLYWKIALLIGLLIIMASSFFGYNLFTKINQETILPDSNAGGQGPSVDKGRLEKIIDLFSKREDKSLQIINSPVTVVDPSL